MSRFTAAILVALFFTACAAAPPLEKHRGMNYACAFHPNEDVRYGSPSSEAELKKLHALGVNWISIMPFGFQRSDPIIRMGGYEDDDSLRGATRQARALGIKVMLKPHIWARDEAAMQGWTDEQWKAWFVCYEDFITHYAKLARDEKMDALCIGNEQKHSTRFEAEWRRIIARVREIYAGPITYGANFDEVERVAFWDALDWIGVSGYFPLVDELMPARAQLVEAWQPVIARLRALSRRYRRPVLFTEIGYRSTERAAWRQWELPLEGPRNLEVQRDAYAAFFEAVWPQPWLAGVYPWKWFSGPEHDEYEIENKPAAEVVRRHYTAR
jgi:hypothetical protein